MKKSRLTLASVVFALLPIESFSLDNESLGLQSYCDFSYQQLLEELKDVEDAKFQIGENYFIAYNPDNLGIGISRYSKGIYMIFGRTNDRPSFTEERGLREEEICNTLEEVLKNGSFHSQKQN